MEYLKMKSRILSRNRRLAKDNNLEPRTADRAVWAEFAVASFASVTGLKGDLRIDPETVLSDLLADLMHWCDVQKNQDCVEQRVDFESALERASEHYSRECADQR